MLKIGLVLVIVYILVGCSFPINGVQKTSTSTPVIPLGIGSTQVSPKDGMTMVFVPAGNFLMGSPEGVGREDEHPQHTVTLDAYWIDQTEVTNGKYAQCVADKACTLPSVNSSMTRDSYYGNPAFDNFPVVYVHWSDAVDYCKWSGRRLPTEAEWEKAARGTEGHTYPWGNTPPDSSLANYKDIIGDTAEVGSYPAGASPYGALDMVGNVFEIVADHYDANYFSNSPLSNPKGPDSDGPYAVRSSSWSYGELDMAASRRNWVAPHDSFVVSGFRCALSP
jgi:formylglycine-generating enzyme required for sulfatase activity